MYYAAQDPIALTGEKREPPKVEIKPVTEETPQFKNIYIKNVVVNGAQKAIFVRGLPEMNVKNIVMEDMVLQAKEGLDMTEGTGITLKNVQLITENKNPVMNIHNSQNITLANVGYKDAEVLLNVTGEKSKEIALSGTDTKKAKKGVEFGYGATEKAVKIGGGLKP
jgi:copper homeostasis protein CutC